jgi:tetratricopeptide (TPR) repeat protein
MSALERQNKHREGLKYFYSGQFTEAIEIFSEAKTIYGSHVGLLSDLSAAYYVKGDMQAAQRIRRELEDEYLAAEPLLSEESKVQTLIYLSKMREEDGEIAGALKALETALEFCGDDKQLRIRVATQLVRMTAMFEMRTELAQYYRDLIFYSGENQHFNIEIEHALMLAEDQLVGLSQATFRFNKLKEMNLNIQDLRLVFFDYAEIVLRRGQWNDELSVDSLRFDSKDLDGFEKAMQLFGLSLMARISIQDLDRLSKQLSFMGYLRVAGINISRTQDEEEKRSMRLQILLLLESTDSVSKQLLLKRWNSIKAFAPGISAPEAITLELLESSKEISFKSLSYSFARKENAWTLLLLLKQSAQLDLETIAHKIGIAEYDENAFHRLRMIVTRLNKDLAQITGIPQVLLIRQQQLIVQSVRFL